MICIDSKEKYEIILVTATRFFTRQGFRKTSVDEIAKAAKVGKATIYQLFHDKAGLLDEVYRCKAQELKGKMTGIDPEEEAIPRLLKMLNIARDFFSNDPLFSRFLEQREIEELEALPQFRVITNEAVKLIDQVLTEGISRGEIRPLPTQMAAHFCFRIGFHLIQYGRELFDKYSVEEVLELFDSVLTSGIVLNLNSASNLKNPSE